MHIPSEPLGNPDELLNNASMEAKFNKVMDNIDKIFTDKNSRNLPDAERRIMELLKEQGKDFQIVFINAIRNAIIDISNENMNVLNNISMFLLLLSTGYLALSDNQSENLADVLPASIGSKSNRHSLKTSAKATRAIHHKIVELMFNVSSAGSFDGTPN